MRGKSIHVVGGASGIGRWLIDHVLKGVPRVFCYDVDKINLARLPQHITACLIGDDGSYEIYRQNFSDEDTVLFTIPPDKFHAAVSNIRDHVRLGSLLVACNSVQGPAILSLRDLAPGHCHFMGCHPLFAPTLRMPDGFTAVLTEYDEAVPIKFEFEKLIRESGLSIVHLPVEEHDKYMAIVQSLTHFCLLAFCKTITESGTDISKLKNVRTPNFQFLYAFGSRILRLSSSTTAAIQMEPIASEIRTKFLSSASKLHEDLSKTLEISDASAIISKLSVDFKEEHFEEGASISDAAVDAIQRFESVLRRHKEAKIAFIFRHTGTKQVRIVKIKKIDTDEIIIEDAAVQVGNRLAINYDNIAKQNYKHMGIHFIEGAAIPLKKRYIQLLAQKELVDIRNNAVPISVEYYFANPHKRSREFFEYWLPQAVPGLVKCTVIKQKISTRTFVTMEYRPEMRRSEILFLINALLNRRHLKSTRQRSKVVR